MTNKLKALIYRWQCHAMFYSAVHYSTFLLVHCNAVQCSAVQRHTAQCSAAIEARGCLCVSGI